MAGEEKDTPQHEGQTPGIGLRIITALGYCALFLLPLLTHPNNKFAQFHANQALLVLIVALTTVGLYMLSLAGFALGPVGILAFLIIGFFALGFFILSLMIFFTGILNALSGKMERVSIVGKFNLIKGKSGVKILKRHEKNNF
ncbi:MAG: hypothetical protein WDZ75_00995 [Candidatus Paceibacterota bacterium]